MAKPPKTKVVTPDSTSPPKTSPHEGAFRSDYFPGEPGTHSLGTEPYLITSSPNSPDTLPLPVSAVEVVDMSVGDGHTPDSAARMIFWPPDQIQHLSQFGDTGLFLDRDQRMYANLGEQGFVRVETNADGDFQVPLPFAPDQAGPVLLKEEGKPQWSIARRGAVPVAGTPVPPAPVEVLPAHLANTLTAADENGLRYGKMKRGYVELENEGTVRIHQSANGELQATSSSELTPSGPMLERIEGTTLWKRKAQDDTDSNGPGKRPRLEENNSPATPDAFSAQRHANPYRWIHWGKISKPENVESIQIGPLHFQVVAPVKSNASQSYALLQHPEFSPSSFETFEQMLNNRPSLQPVIALRTNQDPWVVERQTLFENTLTQSVADSFTYYSDHTSRAVAERLFELSTSGPARKDLGYIRSTFEQWKTRPDVASYIDPIFDEPMNLLPVAQSNDSGTTKIIPVLPLEPAGPLQRLEFDPQRFPAEWADFSANRSDHSLQRLVSSLLVRSGYDVFPLTTEHRGPTLVFRRKKQIQIYFLKLGHVGPKATAIKLPRLLTPELEDPNLTIKIGADAVQALKLADEQNAVVWLVGGVQETASGQSSVFVFKER